MKAEPSKIANKYDIVCEGEVLERSKIRWPEKCAGS